jgi:putative transposase
LEAENEKLRAKVGELVMQMDHLKKLQAWVQRRKNADTSIITAKNWDQFRKPAK